MPPLLLIEIHIHVLGRAYISGVLAHKAAHRDGFTKSVHVVKCPPPASAKGTLNILERRKGDSELAFVKVGFAVPKVLPKVLAVIHAHIVVERVEGDHLQAPIIRMLPEDFMLILQARVLLFGRVGSTLSQFTIGIFATLFMADPLSLYRIAEPAMAITTDPPLPVGAVINLITS